MSAPYALPGDVLEMKGMVILWSPDGEGTRLLPGYYGLLSQSDEMLTFIPLQENETGAMVLCGEPFCAPLSFLDLTAVRITRLTFIR
jgi:hypothetical protein